MTPDQIDAWPESLWFDTAIPLQDQPVLEGLIDTEVAVIGAGYTGLSTALHLAESAVETVVIDKVQPGWGCSGRNGGQINPNWKVLPEDIKKFYTTSGFEQMIGVVNQTCDLVFDLIDRYQIDCQAIKPGYILGIIGRAGMNFVQSWTDQWRVAGADVELLSRDAIATMLGTSHYDGGMLDHRGGSLQPLSYARGLASACLQNGARIYGNSPVLSISASNGGWRIKSAAGEVQCRKLIIGMNGYTDASWAGLAQNIIPVASLISATEPLPEAIARDIIPGRNAVSESGGVPHYYRMDENNRMVFGGRGTVFGHTGNLDTTALRNKAIELYPQLRDVKWEYDWGGYVAMTTHHRPMLLHLADNVYAGLGYNGRGVAMATMMGKQLAMVARGETPELAMEQPKRIPLHGFHNLGIAARVISGHLVDACTSRIG